MKGIKAASKEAGKAQGELTGGRDLVAASAAKHLPEKLVNLGESKEH